MSDTVIKVEGLYKKFTKSIKRSMLYGTMDAARTMFGISYDEKQLRKNEFWALEDINFELKRGETLGLIGQNGCGKTTLLRLINGIFPPDAGKITINGRIGALIAVGAGFHPHMTGRENIYLNATILGMKKDEITRKLDSIVDFAEIGDFIDSPVNTYSSGMTVRLGFAIAIHGEPDILLLDEILAVGDYNFQYKCLEKIKKLKREGMTVIFVSHSESSIRAICANGLLLEKGVPKFIGSIDNVYNEYTKNDYEKIKQVLYNTNNIHKKLTENEFTLRRGNGKIRFTDVFFCDLQNNRIEKIPYGTKTIRIYSKYYATDDIEQVRVGFNLRDATKGEYIWVYKAFIKNDLIDIVKGFGELYFNFNISHLGPNMYGLYIGFSDSEISELPYDIWDINGVFLEIESNYELNKRGFNIAKPISVNEVEIMHIRNTTSKILN